MPKLVVLSEGLTGRSYDLSTVLTTIGRLEDNTFQIPEPSVSSHHCEILLRGEEIIIKDLNSTNGTFINGQKITGEAPVKTGQIIRLGQVEVRLEGEQAAAAAKKMPEKTVAIPTGVNLSAADQGTKTIVFDKNSPFAKKSNRGTKMFVIGAIVVGTILIGVILWIVLVGAKTMGQ
jgi:pSer/pThr/pTyr-binding forkhead associated (FHA) protein